jgi:cell division protein FtsL
MAKPKRLVQAYKQAPWRIATQRGVLFLIVAILIASILWVMVSVTVQAASAGLEIQALEDEREVLQRHIAGLRTGIASNTSAERMKERAAALGFEQLQPEAITYMVVPGYQGREPINEISQAKVDESPKLIKPIYTQSLWEWLLQGVYKIGESPGFAEPVVPRDLPGGTLP